MDEDLFQTLLNEVVRIEITEHGNQQEPNSSATLESKLPLEILEGLQLLCEDMPEVFSGYFGPETAQNYEFILPKVTDKPSFIVNGVRLVVESTSLGWRTEPIALASGQHYHITSTANLKQIY